MCSLLFDFILLCCKINGGTETMGIFKHSLEGMNARGRLQQNDFSKDLYYLFH
jgi:hypothetical protein